MGPWQAEWWKAAALSIVAQHQIQHPTEIQLHDVPQKMAVFHVAVLVAAQSQTNKEKHQKKENQQKGGRWWNDSQAKCKSSGRNK